MYENQSIVLQLEIVLMANSVLEDFVQCLVLIQVVVQEGKGVRIMFVQKYATQTQTVKLERFVWKGLVILVADLILIVKLQKFVSQINVDVVADLTMVRQDAEMSTNAIKIHAIPPLLV